MADIPSRSNRIGLFFFAAGLTLISLYVGVKLGMHYQQDRLLFELSPLESIRIAFRQTLGIQKSYSQAEQDLWIVLSVLPGKRNGFYVDVGSGDGEEISNTNLLDQLGWKGVCIDPFPTNMKHRTCQMFRQPVSSESGKKVTFRAAGFLGGITENLKRHEDEVANAPVVELSTATLDEILDKAKAPQHIEYMSIDIEGAEFEALRGLSLDRYEVDAFTIEHNNEKEKREAIRQLLESRGYVRVRSWFVDDWYVRRDLAHYAFTLDWALRK